MSARNPHSDLAAPAISGLAPYEPGKPSAELKREFGLSDVIKLASNENPLGPSPTVKAALLAAADDIERYPDGAAFELRDALAKHLRVAPQQLTLGNGSNDVLVLLAETFLTPNVAAVYDQYSFVVYRLVVQACAAEARVSPANPPSHAQPLGHDLEAMRALVDKKTRLVFIANPNNPTGTWLEQDELRSFLRDMPNHVITVVDEAYLEYARQSDEPDTLAWLDEFPQLVIVRTFSKAYGLAGLRIGYGISSPSIAELLNRVRQPFNVNSMAQKAALAGLADQQWVQRGVATNAAGMLQLQQGLDKLGWRWIPSRGNFLLVDLGSSENAAACNQYLLRAGVIVRPVANYGLPAYLRITVGTADETGRLLQTLAGFAGSR
jgi:histidinol-phosphate aminotransferase